MSFSSGTKEWLNIAITDKQLHIFNCKIHGHQLCTSGSKAVCQECKRIRKQKTRTERKSFLVQKFGNCCSKCGYNASNWALTFHHRNPDDKEFGLNCLEKVSVDKLLHEAAKCDLLCHNCHMQLHERIYHSGSIIIYDLLKGGYNVAK